MQNMDPRTLSNALHVANGSGWGWLKMSTSCRGGAWFSGGRVRRVTALGAPRPKQQVEDDREMDKQRP